MQNVKSHFTIYIKKEVQAPAVLTDCGRGNAQHIE